MKRSKKTEFDNLVDEHLEIALKEVASIKPWFDEDYKVWVFEHKFYPVEYFGNTKEEVIRNYPLYLRGFIEFRLKGKLNPLTEKQTKGRGGKRPGAGRPIGTKKTDTMVIRLPLEIATWLKSDPAHLEEVRALFNH